MGKKVLAKERTVAKSKSFTYLGQISFDSFPGFGSQHQSIKGQDLCVAIGNVPLFQSKFYMATYREGKKCKSFVSLKVIT